jgi:hypothetical protein
VTLVKQVKYLADGAAGSRAPGLNPAVILQSHIRDVLASPDPLQAHGNTVRHWISFARLQRSSANMTHILYESAAKKRSMNSWHCCNHDSCTSCKLLQIMTEWLKEELIADRCTS